jgi:hypothetical protein
MSTPLVASRESVAVTFRVSRALRQQIEMLARRDQRTVSDYLRLLVTPEIKARSSKRAPRSRAA